MSPCLGVCSSALLGTIRMDGGMQAIGNAQVCEVAPQKTQPACWATFWAPLGSPIGAGMVECTFSSLANRPPSTSHQHFIIALPPLGYHSRFQGLCCLPTPFQVNWGWDHHLGMAGIPILIVSQCLLLYPDFLPWSFLRLSQVHPAAGSSQPQAISELCILSLVMSRASCPCVG